MTRKIFMGGKFLAVLIAAAASLPACHTGPPEISIESASARMSPAIYGEAMVFMTIKNDGGPDVLKSVSIDVPGASTMFHIMKGHHMARVPEVPVPGGKSVVLKMGSSHIMVEDMPRSMGAGSPITLTLVFERSGIRQLHLRLEKAPPVPMS